MGLNSFIKIGLLGLITVPFTVLAWDLTAGGWKKDEFLGLVEISDTTFWALGYSQSRELGSQKNFLLSANLYGQKLFGRYSGEGDKNLLRKGIKTEKGIFLVGVYNNNFAIYRANRYGKIIWVKVFGKGEATAIAKLSDGFAAVGFVGTSPEKDILVVKMDENGNILWKRRIGDAGDDRAFAVIPFEGNSIVVAGYTSSKGSGEKDGYLVFLTSEGEIYNEITYGERRNEEFHSLIPIRDGLLLVGSKEPPYAGLSDAWLVKVNKDGSIIFQKTFGKWGDDGANAIIKTDDGGFLIAGYTDSKGAGGKDAWLIKIDRFGNKLWDKTFGGWQDDWANDVIQTADGDFLFVGYTESKGSGSGDGWILKFSP